jgi:hypothetical protein
LEEKRKSRAGEWFQKKLAAFRKVQQEAMKNKEVQKYRNELAKLGY